MIEAIGDLWIYPCNARCVTTNGVVKSNGELVMGKGVALQAARRYIYLPIQAGYKVKTFGNHLFVFQFSGEHIITFPTKHHWRDKSNIALIEASARRLMQAADHFKWDEVAMTRPGCGNGQLLWDDVKKVIAPILDDRFVVLTPR